MQQNGRKYQMPNRNRERHSQRCLFSCMEGDGQMEVDFTTLLVFMGVPSAVTGFCFWAIQKNITRRDAQHDEIEKAREKNEVLLVRSVSASIALGEATARAVQRIPDAHCNGDMKGALEYAQKVKNEQKDFMTEQGMKNLY